MREGLVRDNFGIYGNFSSLAVILSDAYVIVIIK